MGKSGIHPCFTRKWGYVHLGMLLLLTLMPWHGSWATSPITEKNLLQFTAGGHVLGFQEDGILIASGTHALHIGFVNGSAKPVAEEVTTTTKRGHPRPLHKVNYRNLWPGIDLDYSASDNGITESTWRLEPGSNPDQIQLRYKAPVGLNGDGSLKILYPTGWMRESAPKAWQIIDGKETPIQVEFRVLKSSSPVSSVSTLGFKLSEYDDRYPLVIDPTLTWNAFLGSTSDDKANAVAVDGSGNVLVTGVSNASWGTNPVSTYSGGQDIFVAKFSPNGTLLWNTFWGGIANEIGEDIVVDGGDNVLVIGEKQGPTDYYPWVSVIKFSSNGNLLWSGGLGHPSSDDHGLGIATDSTNNVLVTGYVTYFPTTDQAYPYVGGNDIFVAKLSASTGNKLWTHYLGSSSDDVGEGIATDDADNVLVTGYSDAGWGLPKRGHSGGIIDAFVAKLNSDGTLQWNTFLGGSRNDRGYSIASDESGNVFVTGYSKASWQGTSSPIRPYQGSFDAFVAKLSPAGVLQWNTFLGSSDGDAGYGIAVTNQNHVLVTGVSNSSWESPKLPYTNNQDAFIANLNTDGSLQWNGFLGGIGTDYGKGIAVNSSSILVAGYSSATWGSSPVYAHVGGDDAFVAKIFDETLVQKDPDQECTFYVIPLKNHGSVVLCL
jgi:hypothetical protein